MTNKTILFDKFGGELYVKDLPIPKELKDDEVRIKNVALGIGRVEELFHAGEIRGIDVKFPSSLGYESSGIVDGIGKNVTKFKIGDSVSVLQNTSQDKYTTNGEYCIQPESSLVLNPPNVSHEQACSIWFSYLTAYFPLRNLKQGDTVLITAASSSTGLGAIQLAKLLGAKVIATSRSDSKKKQLLDFGADHFVNTSDANQFEQQVLDITNNHGVDVVYDPIGGEFIKHIINVCARNAHIYIYGVTGGETLFPIRDLFYKNIKMEAYLVFNYSTDPLQLQECVNFYTHHLEHNHFSSIIGKTYNGIESTIDAYKYLQKSDLFGKTIIKL